MNNITKLPNSQFRVEADMDIYHTQEKLAHQNKLIPIICRIVWNIFSIIVFPILIGRVFVFFAKKLASSLVLQAAGTYNLDKAKNLKDKIYIQDLHKKREYFIADPANKSKQVTVTTADGKDLDSIVIENKDQMNQLPANQKWIIFFHGNATCYEEDMHGLKFLSEKTGASVLSGNYRGVMRSQGSANSSHDLILDGEAMVQYLLKQGIPSKNIFLHGWSLGGAIATEVAANHQNENDEMSVCSDRSFTTLKDVMKAWIPGLTGTIVGKMAWSMGWKFDSLTNFQKIKGYKFTIHSKIDKVIRYEASLYKAIKDLQMTAEDKKLKKERDNAKMNGIKKNDLHNQDYKPEKALRIRHPDEVQQNRKALLESRGFEAHCTPLHAILLNPKVEDVFNKYLTQVKEALSIA